MTLPKPNDLQEFLAKFGVPTDGIGKMDALDRIEALIANAADGCVAGLGEDIEDCPTVHTFTPGLYSRRIFMPAGKVITSKTHRTEHQFAISQGRLAVWDPFNGPQWLEAPHHGVTRAGTRRLLVIFEDTVWTTYHATTATDEVQVEAEIIEPSSNPYLKAIGKLPDQTSPPKVIERMVRPKIRNLP